ncbi:MAG: hypothetical protein NC328_00550 [Muribaculum sp.]|nr:hypothetical protein [Muribaculum sp.]
MIVTVVGALGGLEFVKWISTRKSQSRMEAAKAQSEETSANSAREKLCEDTITFLQTQLHDKELRFAEQTDLLRSTTAHELELTRRVGELEQNLILTRCDLTACPHRQPPFPWQQTPQCVVAEGNAICE